MPYSATKRITIFRTARVRAAPEWRVGTAVRSRRVSCKHAFTGRLLSRSEISIGDWLGGGMGVGLGFLCGGDDLQVIAFLFMGAC
jgi:hypothetical protein